MPILIHDSILLDIQEFLQYYIVNFSHATVIPKKRILEDHMVLWLRRWHLGVDLMGEQGADSVHSPVKKLEENYSCIEIWWTG